MTFGGIDHLAVLVANVAKRLPTLIDSGHWLGVPLLMALVIGLMDA